MIKINNNQIDLIVQIEDSVSINKLFNKLTLEVDNILVICTQVFFTRLIQFLYEDNMLDDNILHSIEGTLNQGKNYLELSLQFKGKIFRFYFIILSNEVKVVNHPIKGLETYSIGFKEIEI